MLKSSSEATATICILAAKQVWLSNEAEWAGDDPATNLPEEGNLALAVLTLSMNVGIFFDVPFPKMNPRSASFMR